MTRSFRMLSKIIRLFGGRRTSATKGAIPVRPPPGASSERAPGPVRTGLTSDVFDKDILPHRSYEEDITELAPLFIQPNTTVLDVGAGDGKMSILFSEMVGTSGRVMAFEAEAQPFALLESNLQANPRQNITVHHRVCFVRSGEWLSHPGPKVDHPTSAGLEPRGQLHQKVETLSIDDLSLAQPVSLMKVKTDGCNLLVLQGAAKTIQKHHMPILLEYKEQLNEASKTSLQDYLRLMSGLSYRIERVFSKINLVLLPCAPVLLDAGVPGVPGFNRVLDNDARRLYQPVIEKLFGLLPEMMARKIPAANVQQAFVFDTVVKFASRFQQPKILCVGCFEDTAWAGLEKVGYQIEAIDPAVNMDLNTFFNRETTRKESYQIIFSTSVLEHVQEDELFMKQIGALLAPGGVAILTCDFNSRYQPGDRIPKEDIRFYTEKDFIFRLLPGMTGCGFVDCAQWQLAEPDFTYAGCRYSFATFVVEKRR